jgi:hypothetical protein
MSRSLVTSGFIALSGLFAAHVAGNLVLIGGELAHSLHGVLMRATIRVIATHRLPVRFISNVVDTGPKKRRSTMSDRGQHTRCT